MFRRIAPLLAVVLVVAACGTTGPNRDRLMGNGVPEPEAMSTMQAYMQAVSAGASSDELWSQLPKEIRDSRAKERWVASSPKPLTAAEKRAIAKLVVAKGGKMLSAGSSKWLTFTGKSSVAFAVLQRASISSVIPDFKITLDPVEKANTAARVAVDGLSARPSVWNPGQRPNDVYLDELWGLQAIDASTAWKRATGKNVVVAVLDTGIDASHPDLRGAAFVNGYDFVEGLDLYAAYKDDWPESRYIPHGTHVAGTIGAVANNGYGIIGVAPNAKLMPVRVLDEEGSGYLSDVAAGIEWAANKGAKVANLSLRAGGFGFDAYQELAEAFGPSIGVAMSKGMTVVAASGNDYVHELYEDVSIWPADDPRVIRVAAFGNYEGYYASEFSNSAPNVTVTAPGENVLSTYSPRGYSRWAGTSMATPHVAGVVALMKSINGSLTPAQLRAYLRAGAIDTTEEFGWASHIGFDEQSGSGMLSASAAVAAAAKRGVLDLAVGNPLVPRITPDGGFTMTISTNAANARCSLSAALYSTPVEGMAYLPMGAWGLPGTEEFPRELLSEAALPGTTCGSRAVSLESLDAAFAAAGQDPIPSGNGGLSIVFTARTGTLSAQSYAVPLLPPDTVTPEIASVDEVGGPYTLDYARYVRFTDAYTLDPYDWSADVALETTWSDGSTTSVESMNALLEGACAEPANVFVFDFCTYFELDANTDEITADHFLGSTNAFINDDGVAEFTVLLGRYDLNDLPKWAKVFSTVDETSTYGTEFLKSLYAGADPVATEITLTVADSSANSVAEDQADTAPVAVMTLVQYAEGNPEDVVWSAGPACGVTSDTNSCDSDMSTYYYELEDGSLPYPFDFVTDYTRFDGVFDVYEVYANIVGNAYTDATFTYTGSGNEILISAIRGDAFDGTISIEIDGVPIEAVDLTGDGSTVDEHVVLRYAVVPGEHTLVVTATGEVNLSSVRIGDSFLP